MQLIEFFDLLADEGWEPASYEQSNPNFLWADGGSLADAPVDIAATLDPAVSRSLRVDGDFNMAGARVQAGFTVPWHHNNLRELVIVMGGEFTVEWGDDGEQRVIKAGDFWISDAGTKHTMTAGPQGVTYIETWPVWVQLVTTWHDGPGWVRR